jgi:quercetin dioxygenase-like cupin family protein
MKTIITLILLMLSCGLYAQDWTKVNPEMTAVISDTNLVLAYVASIEPGQKSAMHTHPASFFFAITDLKLKVYYTDGQFEVLEVPSGQGAYLAPEKMHQTENISDKTAKFLLVELKEHPYTSSSNK